jgi:hypothetical protein
MSEVLEVALVPATKGRAASKDPTKPPTRDGGANGSKSRGSRPGGKTLSAAKAT